jgi:hypothetical protein
MSAGYPGSYEPTYKPYRSVGATGNRAFDYSMMAFQMFGPSMGMPNVGGSFNSPFTNAAQQQSKLNNDLMFRQMLSSGVQSQRRIFGDTLAAMPNTLTAAGGQAYTPEQQRAYATLADAALLAAPSLVGWQGGRRSLDAMFGGNAAINTHAAIGMQMRRMMDPFELTPHFGADFGNRFASGLHKDLFGGSTAQRRFGMQGYRAADLAPMVNYLSSTGSFVDPSLSASLLGNQDFLDAARRGDISQDQLNNMGVGKILKMADGDLSPGQMRGATTKNVVQGASTRIRELSQTMRAMEEIIGPQSELLKSTGQFLGHVEEFTREYKSQVGSKQVGQLLRESREALSDFGYGYQDLRMLNQHVSGMGQQFGYRGGSNISVLARASAAIGGASDSQMFNAQAYGAMNRSQFTNRIIHDDFAFGRSEMGNSMAAMMGYVRNLGDGAFSDDEAGRRAQKIFRNIQSGADIGDSEFMGASPTEMMQIMSQGLSGSGHFERMLGESRYGFTNERRYNEFGLGSYTARMQRERFLSTQSQMAAQRSLGGLGEGLSSEQQTRLMGQLGRSMGEGLLGLDSEVAADRSATRATLGSRLVRELQERAADGDAAAEQALNNLGTTDEERQKRAGVLAGQYMVDVEEFTNDALVNTVNRMGDDSIAMTQQTARRAAVKAYVNSALADTTNNSLYDSLMAGVDKFSDRDPSKPITADEISGLLNSALKNSGDSTTNNQMRSLVRKLKKDEQALAEFQGSGDSQDAAYKDELQKRQAAVKSVRSEIQEAFRARMDAEAANEKNAEESATVDKQSQAAATGGGQQIQINSPTFVFDNVTFEANGPAKSLPNTPGKI